MVQLDIDWSDEVQLHEYTDLDWAVSKQDKKSTSGCYFSVGSAMISWMSKKQTYVALNTVEVEYIVSWLASCEVVLLRN